MDTCICMAESLLYSPEIVTILLFGDIPIKNKKLKKKKQHRATKKKNSTIKLFLYVCVCVCVCLNPTFELNL